jgi:hypothetical protein
VIIENLDQQNDHDQERYQPFEHDVLSCPLRRGGRRESVRGRLASKGTKANSLTQPIDGVRLSHRAVRELALACRKLSPCFRYELVGTKGSSILSKKMTITLPSISRALDLDQAARLP